MLRECRWDDWASEAACVNFKTFSRVAFKTFAAVILLQNCTSLRGEIANPNVCWPCKTGTSWYFRALFWFITWPPSCLNMKDSTLVSYKYYDKGLFEKLYVKLYGMLQGKLGYLITEISWQVGGIFYRESSKTTGFNSGSVLKSLWIEKTLPW